VKFVKIPFAFFAACMLCCAIPLSSLSPGLLEMSVRFWGATSGAGIVIFAAVLALWLAKRSRRALKNVRACGCASNTGCHTTASDLDSRSDTRAILACTLRGDDYQVRVNWIRELNAQSLRRAERSPSSLRLSYNADAVEDVRKLVQAEQGCCTFLTFQQIEQPDGVVLAITAPVEIDDVDADAAFAPFVSHGVSITRSLSS